MIKSLFNKYRPIIAYLFFGICTTIINISSYVVCYNYFNIENITSTIVAWIFAVIVAYITNKIYVFDSKEFSFNIVFREIISFFSCRVLTGIIDVGVMYIAVDIMEANSILWKTISNIFVIISNYFASKLFVFKNQK